MSEGNGRASLREVMSMLNRIEDKIDGRISKHEDRIRSLERWRAWSAGVAAAVSFAFYVGLRMFS